MADSNDDSVMDHIKSLTDRERQLYGKESLTDDDIKELHQVKSSLDQYWDLLHQRRGFRDAGEDPDDAQMRSPGTIDNYEQ